MPSRLGVKDVFVVKKIERPFPNNVHTATLSVNCIETELTFVSKTCAVFYLTKSIRPATCRLLVQLQSSWWTFALFCDDITACNRIEFWINLFHNTSRDWIYDFILDSQNENLRFLTFRYFLQTTTYVIKYSVSALKIGSSFYNH